MIDRRKLRAIRDRLLEGGRLVDTGGRGGMCLWHADDPATPLPYTRERIVLESAAIGS